jgi:DNA-binding MarR family transcriptional regulator
MTTRWLTAGEERAWRAFLQLQGQLTAELNRQLQTDSGLSLADYDVLVQLTDTAEGRLRPYELQALLHWEQSRLSHHLSRMRRRGLITRTGCAEDGRGAYVVLTAAGRAAIEAAAPGHVATVRRLFVDALTSEQLSTVEQASGTITELLRPGR